MLTKMIAKNIEDRKHFKRTNRIVKERIKERKNRMWEVKYKEIDSMFGNSQLIKV